MEYLGYGLAVLVGLSLGLIGSGGSILTIPILVYIMGINPSTATTYSLFIVGVAALSGVIKGAAARLVNFRMVLFFGVPGLAAIFCMRKFLLPLVPSQIISTNNFSLSKDMFIMIVFAVLMMLASTAMIKKQRIEPVANKQVPVFTIFLLGLIVGLLTGFVGVGGGFLIIPILVLVAGLSMKSAVATSLVIIAINALVGFCGSDLSNIDWKLLLIFTALACAGIFIGMLLAKKISNEKLKPAFGWFVLVSGIYILLKETLFKT